MFPPGWVIGFRLTGALWVFWTIVWVLESFSCRFISCGKEPGLWLFRCLTWAFFPQGRVSFPDSSLILGFSLGLSLGFCALSLSGSPKLWRPSSSSHDACWDQAPFVETSFLWHVFVSLHFLWWETFLLGPIVELLLQICLALYFGLLLCRSLSSQTRGSLSSGVQGPGVSLVLGASSSVVRADVAFLACFITFLFLFFPFCFWWYSFCFWIFFASFFFWLVVRTSLA